MDGQPTILRQLREPSAKGACQHLNPRSGSGEFADHRRGADGLRAPHRREVMRNDEQHLGRKGCITLPGVRWDSPIEAVRHGGATCDPR